MKNKKHYTLEEIKQHSTTTIVEESSAYTDEFGNVHDIDEDISLQRNKFPKCRLM